MLVAVLVAAAAAPVTPVLAQNATRTQVRCAGQLITEVIIRSQSPAFGGVFARSPLLGKMVTSLQVTTSPSVIRNFVLLEKGQRCSALRRSESERILRAMPFISDASVTAYPDGMDGVRIEVVTVDEPTIVGRVGVENHSPYFTGLSFGNANLLGNAVYASMAWREGFYYRDRYSGRYTNYQLWGKPYQLELSAARRELGSDWVGEVSLPYLTDVQRSAWRVAGGQSREFARFLRPNGIASSLAIDRKFADAGVMLRVGRPGKLGLLGAQLSFESNAPASMPVIVTDSGVVRDTTSALIGRYRTTRSARVNALLGFRTLRFLRVTGFDALGGSQDIRIGTQVGVTLGHTLPASRGVARHEKYAAASVYLGVGGHRSFAAIQGDLEGRRSSDTRGWDDVLTRGRAAWYLQPHPRHLLLTEVTWSGGWSARVPYQLSLGARRGGLRGYDKVDVGGARRVIGRVEERWRVGNFRGSAGVGVGIFTELGRVWAGDVPLGLNSGTRQALGLSLTAAVPPRSQRAWRLDIAFPMDHRDGSRWGVRLSNENRTRAFYAPTWDVRRIRERTVPQNIFSWP